MNNLELKEYVDTFSSKYTGNHSIIYPYIENRLSEYECWELPFPGEFLFFEDRYIRVYKDIKSRKLKCLKIIDIGCELGIQSEIFKNEYNYIGIDYYSLKFFNLNDSKCSFLVEKFPDKKLDYKDAIVISNMSLGYFYDKEKETESIKEIVDELKKVKYLYISTHQKLIKELSIYFDIEHLSIRERKNSLKITDVHNNLYFMKRKNLINR